MMDWRKSPFPPSLCGQGFLQYHKAKRSLKDGLQMGQGALVGSSPETSDGSGKSQLE